MKMVQEDIGGVELSATGKFLGQLGHITGLVYDKDRDRLVLVGDGDISLPPMDLSYFAVAEQLVSQGYEEIWFTLDPDDPKNPRGKWMKCIWGPPGLPADLLPGTPPGNVMFEADWLLKQYSFGVEVGENGRIVPRTCHVPGFKDMFTLGFEHFSGSRREIWNRFWIVIGDVIFRRSGNAVVIDNANVRVMTERMYVTSRGLQSSGGVMDPRAEAFAKFFEDHYDEFAQESPQFAQLKEWGKVFALVKWLHNNGIPISVDPEWVQPGKHVAKVTALSGQQEREKTYRRGNAIVTETRIVQLFGGDEVVAKPVEIKDDGRATRFADALHNALKRQPSRSDFPVEVDGRRLTGVILPLTTSGKQLWEKAKSRDTVQQHGLTYHLGPDRKVQYAEDASGMRIDYHRDSKGNLVGFKARSADGWTATATHYSGTVIDVTSPRGDRYTYRWNQEGYLTDVLVNGQSFLHCAYNPSHRMAKISYSGYTQTLTFNGADRLQTWTVESTNGEVGGTRGTLTLNYNEKGQVTHVQTNTGNYLEVTYENGQVRTVRTAGNEVEYSWRDNDRLASLRSGDVSVNYGYEGKELKTINIQRGDAVASAIFENGLLSEVQNFSGGKWSYHYDQQGALVGVSDPTSAEAHYSYDADGHLTKVRLPDGRRLQYVYGQFSDKARQGKTTNLVRLLAVNLLPEGHEGQIEGQASRWQTLPWKTIGLVGLGILLILGGIWWWRRRQEMWW
jgi:YD repeat-containing protein